MSTKKTATTAARAARKSATVDLDDQVIAWLDEIKCKLLRDQPHRPEIPNPEALRYALCTVANQLMETKAPVTAARSASAG